MNRSTLTSQEKSLEESINGKGAATINPPEFSVIVPHRRKTRQLEGGFTRPYIEVGNEHHTLDVSKLTSSYNPSIRHQHYKQSRRG